MRGLAEEFTIAPMRRLIKSVKNLRVSEDAGEELRQILGEFGLKLAEEAIHEAEKESRKTVLKKDVRAAADRLLGRSNP